MVASFDPNSIAMSRVEARAHRALKSAADEVAGAISESSARTGRQMEDAATSIGREVTSAVESSGQDVVTAVEKSERNVVGAINLTTATIEDTAAATQETIERAARETRDGINKTIIRTNAQTELTQQLDREARDKNQPKRVGLIASDYIDNYLLPMKSRNELLDPSTTMIAEDIIATFNLPDDKEFGVDELIKQIIKGRVRKENTADVVRRVYGLDDQKTLAIAGAIKKFTTDPRELLRGNDEQIKELDTFTRAKESWSGFYSVNGKKEDVHDKQERLAEVLGHAEEKIAKYTEAMREDPDDMRLFVPFANALKDAGIVAEKKGDNKKAFELQRRSLEAHRRAHLFIQDLSGKGETLRRLSRLAANQGDIASAQKYEVLAAENYAELLVREPGNKFAKYFTETRQDRAKETENRGALREKSIGIFRGLAKSTYERLANLDQLDKADESPVGDDMENYAQWAERQVNGINERMEVAGRYLTGIMSVDTTTASALKKVAGQETEKMRKKIENWEKERNELVAVTREIISLMK